MRTPTQGGERGLAEWAERWRERRKHGEEGKGDEQTGEGGRRRGEDEVAFGTMKETKERQTKGSGVGICFTIY